MMRFRIGLIGAGFMGKAHSAAYATMQMHVWPPAAVPELAVVADQDAAAAASGAKSRMPAGKRSVGRLNMAMTTVGGGPIWICAAKPRLG